MSDLPIIPEFELRTLCKVGQREKCCRYIVADATGVCCVKRDPDLAAIIDRRVAAGLFTAQGDNCPGKLISPA